MLTERQHQEALPEPLKPVQVRQALELAWETLVESRAEGVERLTRLSEMLESNSPDVFPVGIVVAADARSVLNGCWTTANVEEMRQRLRGLHYLLFHTERNLHLVQAFEPSRMTKMRFLNSRNVPYGGISKWQHSVRLGKSSTPHCAQIKQPSQL